MAIQKPEKIKDVNITSVGSNSFNAGVDERGPWNIPANALSVGRNVMINSSGNVVKRYVKKRWLPDTVGFNGEIKAIYYGNQMYYFVADDGRIKYIQSGDLDWTEIGTADTAATLTTSLSGDDNDLVFTAVQSGYNSNLARGANGDNVTITYADPSANDSPLSISVANDTEITVSLATNGAGAITTIASDIIAAIAADDTAKKLVVATNAPSNDGSGVVTAMSSVALSGGVSGTNWVTTTEGVMTTFLRINDCLLVNNGVDKMRYVDLSTMDMVVFAYVADPSNAPTAARTGLSAGSYSLYYGITFNGAGGGETAMSPILTYDTDIYRQTWDPTTQYLTITRNNTAPAGAESWNLYLAIAIEGSTPQASDLVAIKTDIPLSTTTFVDNGTIPFDISMGRGSDQNSTEGIVAKIGKDETGTAILYGDPNNPYTLYFSGNAVNGVSFGVKNGAQRLDLNKGTDYYPTAVIGFRNNQGLPNILSLFSSTQGTSKQQIISQKTITYAEGVINYWGADELNTGASGTSSPYAVINYLGKLFYPSSEGIVAIDTRAQIQNVLSSGLITERVRETYGSILSSQYEKIVATAFNDKVFFAVPSRGYTYNNQIMVYDLQNSENPIWYVWDIRADWIGTISPQNSNAFVYVRENNKFYRLEEGYASYDEDINSLTKPFPLVATGSLLPSNAAKNNFYAVSQAVFYVANWVGDISIDIDWWDDRGQHGSETRTFSTGSYSLNTEGGWDNNIYFDGQDFTSQPGWDSVLPIVGDSGAQKIRQRIKIKLPDVVVNEMKFTISSNSNSSFDLINVAYEGVNIGIIGDMG